MPGSPVYSATKAAIHNYTMAMRYSLEGTNVRMIEIAPPAVKTSMNSEFGDEVGVYCAATMDRVEAGEVEVGYNLSETMRLADRSSQLGVMNELAAMFSTPRFPSLNRTD